ncbi:MAG: hypothetical protein JXA93_23975 [Anaerolineae bacterium]|nr:hypothetical protein [Anaerolineae bacterium]
MEELLGALMQGAQQQPDSEEAGTPQDPLAQMLQGFMGGAQQPTAQSPGIGGDPLAQLLQGFMGGQASQTPATPAEPANQGIPDLGSLMQGLGGAGGVGQIPEGYGAPAEMGAAQSAPGLGGLLQVLLGGTGSPAGGTGPAPSSGAGGLGDILSAIMGGGSPTLTSNSLLAPIVDGLAEKLGLPPQIAQAVVAFVLGKLMQHRLQPGIDTTQAPARTETAQPRAASLEDVVARMNSGQRVPKVAVRRAGLAKELAAHTGLDRATAEASVQEVLNALGGQLGTGW